MQSEQLFTDLTPTQAETTVGGSIINDGGGLQIPGSLRFSSVFSAYGKASAVFRREGLNSFSVNSLFVKDTLKDGHPVYALFQARPFDGSSILTTSTRRLDLKGQAGSGTFYDHLNGTFGKSIQQLRVVIMRDNPGRDLFVAGPWVNF
jgi:hypothetical protein